MMNTNTLETTSESMRTVQLEEPLLVQQEKEAASDQEEETCQRRSTIESDPTDVEPLEVAEESGENEYAGVATFRYMWIIFQWVWPAILLTFDINIAISHGDFAVKVFVPSALLFAVIVFEERNNIHVFRIRDAIPTVVWLTLPFFDDWRVCVFIGVIGFIAPVAIACFMHGVTNTLRSACDCFYYNVFVRPSNRFNFYKDQEDEFFEQQQEQEAAELEQLEAQYERLSYLEELAPSHSRKTPIWTIVVLVAAATWTLGFLFYSVFVLLDI